MKRLIVLIVLMSLTSVFSQTKEKVVEIKYGSQVGRCRGYCYSEVIFSRQDKKKIKKSLIDTISYPNVIEVSKIKKTNWEQLTTSINLLEFYSLAKVIGCPDCADEGESWIQIETTKNIHKVRFSRNNVPISIQKLVSFIKEYEK